MGSRYIRATSIMKFLALFNLVFLLVSSVTPVQAAEDASPLPRGVPEEQGVSSARLLDFVEAADHDIDAMNSFILVRHGRVVGEGWWAPYNPQSRHELYSLSKSFTSTAVGLAIAEGKLSLDDEMLKLFPDDAPSDPGANLKLMRIRDLLRMSTGHQDEPSSAADKVSPKTFLAQPVPHKPGTHFKYNTAATFMLSASVQKRTGQTVLDYLGPRLFEPLGIREPVWATNWQGVSLGGYGLRVRTEDIAKFGQLYLQKGLWNGKQLIPAAWVEEATARQTANGSNPNSDWDQGYGFQFWRCRHNAYRGDGAFGQYCLVLPEQDAVLAITSGVKDMQAVLNLVWDKLLAAFASDPLPADPAAVDQLKAKLAGLQLRLPEGDATSPRLAEVGVRTYVFPANDQKLESIRLVPNHEGDGLTLITRSNGVESSLTIGMGHWAKGRGAFGNYRDEPLGAAGAWTGDTLTVKVSAYETPFYTTIKLRFDGDRLVRDVENHVGFGPAKQPERVGRGE
jgi:CubicO group peptidase (beta-lactamase class C family)